MPGEHHRSQHVGCLRAAVLGANDGIVSTESLVLGVAAAHWHAKSCDDRRAGRCTRRLTQAALASAASFAVGGGLPLLVTAVGPEKGLVYLVPGTSLFFLALLGGVATRFAEARAARDAMRVTLWGALAMAVTSGEDRYSELPLSSRAGAGGGRRSKNRGDGGPGLRARRSPRSRRKL